MARNEKVGRKLREEHVQHLHGFMGRCWASTEAVEEKLEKEIGEASHERSMLMKRHRGWCTVRHTCAAALALALAWRLAQ